MNIEAEKLFERFVSYVKTETTSDESSESCPSSEKELVLARMLAQELNKIGMSNVEMTEFGYVIAEIPANADDDVIGFSAHIDTSDEASGANVKAILHKNYDGGKICLSDGIFLDPEEFPELSGYKGMDIITSDGTTLLGADDKAGVAEIVTACEYLLAHPEIPHGKIIVAFTPDEEIGRGTARFPYGKFRVDYAYTVDGDGIGDLNYETFNAASVRVIFHGKSVHPGEAKNKMKSAIAMAAEWLAKIPQDEKPETTEGYQGFYHTTEIAGGTEEVSLSMILRDHDADILDRRKEYLRRLADENEAKYGAGSVTLEIKDSYTNMRQYIEPKFEIVERAVRAMKKADVEPKISPVRGGTDGALLSANGIPCPNIFTGGHNFHGRFEYVPLQSMQKCVEVIINIAATEK